MDPRLERIVARINEVPSLPHTLMEVLRAIDRKESTIDEIAHAIKKDQSLTVHLLRVANSAFYGLLGRVSTVRQAIVLIGFKELKGIVLAQSVFRFFSVESKTDFKRSDLWAHSGVCGFLARKLAKEAFLPDPFGACLIGGLIHDIGKVVIDRYFPEEFIEIIRTIREQEIDFVTAEKEVLGYTHAQIGATLLKKWNFPPELIAPVLYHHSPWSDLKFSQISTAVFYANLLAKVLRYPSYHGEPDRKLGVLKDPAHRAYLEKQGFPVRRSDLVNFMKSAYLQVTADKSGVLDAVTVPVTDSGSSRHFAASPS